MRAGRLLQLLLALQHRGPLTARDLAVELEVSIRTVLRDIEALSGAGVPVRSIRGRNGGFELLDGYTSGLRGPDTWAPLSSASTGRRRATIRISPEGRRLAAVFGRIQPIRTKRKMPPDADGWVEATFRLGPIAATAYDILSLGPDVEVLSPDLLRDSVARLSRATSELYVDQGRAHAHRGRDRLGIGATAPFR